MDDMKWPTLKKKVFPLTVIKLPWGFKFETGGNWYHGNYWSLHIGPWLILGGSGTYDE